MARLVQSFMIIMTVFVLSGCELAGITVLNNTEQTVLTAEDNKLYVMGLLNSKSLGQIQDAVNANPGVDTLVFTAMPGSIDDEVTFETGRWLRSRNMNTHLTARSVIASGAVDLFLSGKVRTMEDGAQVGVHSWSDGDKEAAEYPRDSEEHALNRDYIVDMGVPADFYWFTIYEAPADAISWMGNDEITRYGLLTAPILSGDSSSGIPFEEFEQARKDILED